MNSGGDSLQRMTEWLLFNANSAIFQLYHGENKLIVNEMMMTSLYCREATNTNIIGFGLTRSGLEPTIYRTRGEHDSHYTTVATCDITV